MKIRFRAYFHQKNFQQKSWPETYLGQDPEPDPDPDVFESRIRSKIVRIRTTAYKDFMTELFLFQNPNLFITKVLPSQNLSRGKPICTYLALN
jgi:hypothetical protein